jgi:copper resistance protein C
MRIRVLSAVMLLLFFGGTGHAFAHALFTGSSPAHGECLDAPPEKLTIRFDSQIERRFAHLTVTPEGGETLELEPVIRTERRQGRLSAAMPNLAPGLHEVYWSVVSRDGHRVEGRFSFEVGDDARGNGRTHP